MGLKLVLVGWGSVVLAGLAWLMVHESTPGPSREPPAYFPADAPLPRTRDRATLLLFAHPRCPCTRATLEELETLVSLRGARLQPVVLFLAPRGLSAEWRQTDHWRRAERIEGVTVLEDEDGMRAEQFGARTSGYAVLYSASGALLYHGGITGARGRSGDNPGRQAIEALLDSGQVTIKAECPVYGCPLRDTNRERGLGST